MLRVIKGMENTLTQQEECLKRINENNKRNKEVQMSIAAKRQMMFDMLDSIRPGSEDKFYNHSSNNVIDITEYIVYK